MSVKLDEKGWIYFLTTEDEKFVKIGYAFNVESRIANLQIGSPYEYRLFGKKAGTTRQEKALHKRFKTFRRLGEWFELLPELRGEIEKIIDDKEETTGSLKANKLPKIKTFGNMHLFIKGQRLPCNLPVNGLKVVKAILHSRPCWIVKECEFCKKTHYFYGGFSGNYHPERFLGQIDTPCKHKINLVGDPDQIQKVIQKMKQARRERKFAKHRRESR